MKFCQTFNKEIFDFVDINYEIIDNNITDKLYKFIFIDDMGNIHMIKAIEKAKTNKDKSGIIFNKFKSSQTEIEKNIKNFNGIIYLYLEEEKKNINIFEYFRKIEKSLFKEKYFPKIIIGDKADIQKFLIKYQEKKNKIRDMRILVPEPDLNITLKKGVEEIILMKKIYEKYFNFIMINVFNEKNIISSIYKSRINIMKCKICNEIYEISINNNSNDIILLCDNCHFKKIFDINNLEEFISRIKCSECKKEIYENNSFNHCFKCKKNICRECIKKHLQKEDKDLIKFNNIIYPNNVIDVFCNKHEKICYNYCIDCKKNICIDCELDSHFNHKTKIFELNKIRLLISKQKKHLEKEKEKFEKIKAIVQDCINSLTKFFYKLILYKEKEIYLKEKIIKELELFKFDNILIKNVKNLKFNTNCETMHYNGSDSLEKKINFIFEFFNEPFRLENNKLFLSKNVEGPFDTLQKIVGTDSAMAKNIEKITDICSLHNYKGKNHFAVSYNNGILKIYNDNFQNRIPINIIKVFKENEEIIFLHKSSENFLLIAGICQVKQLYFSKNLLDFKIINEFKIKDQIFKIVLDIFSFNKLIAINNLNQIIFYDCTKKNILSNKSKNYELEEGKEISFADKITDNIIIFHFNSSKDLIELNYETKAFTINFEDNNMNNNINTIGFNTNSSLIINNYYNTKKESSENYWKIFEFEINDNVLEIKNSLSFKSNLNYLGKINDKIILLFNKDLKDIILFDLALYSNILEISFNNFQNPLLCFNLNKAKDFFDLLFVNEEGCLAQYSLNVKLGHIHEIEKININRNEGLNDNKKEDENNIIKMINLSNNSFLFLTNENYLYKLTNPSAYKII